MNRVLIIGCGGSGKSTLARKLGSLTGIPVVHLDRIYWSPGNWEHQTDGEFDAILALELQKAQWILDGNYNRTLPQRLEACDTVIYLDYSRLTCLLGVFKRVLTNYGRTRQDMAPGCKERFDLDFVKWIWNFNRKNRSRYYEMLSGREDLKVYILRSRRQEEELLKEVARNAL